MSQLISLEELNILSYESTLGQSLKQISLRSTPLDNILEDVNNYRRVHTTTTANQNIIGSRFKSKDSILRKYEKTLQMGGGFKQCFNDVLGFRLKLDEYPTAFPDYFRVVDLRGGKKIDDGYRATHLYYQRDNLAYPIELQLWCGKDHDFNSWSHRYTYKYRKPQVGAILYQDFEKGNIKTEEAFLYYLKKLEE